MQLQDTFDYAEAMLAALDAIVACPPLTAIDMPSAFGPLWMPISEELSQKNIIVIDPGIEYRAYPARRENIPALQLKYQSKLNNLRDNINDRQLRRTHTEAQIRDMRQANVRSWIAVGISIVSLLVSILSATGWTK